MNIDSKKALDIMYNLSLSNIDFFEKVEKLKECYNIIADDLDILKILKKYLKNKSLELGIEDIIICCENKKDFEKIKEWLEK